MNLSLGRQPFPQPAETKIHGRGDLKKELFIASHERSAQACVINLQEKKSDLFFLGRPWRQNIYLYGNNIGALILTRLVPAQLGTDRAPDGDLSD